MATLYRIIDNRTKAVVSDHTTRRAASRYSVRRVEIDESLTIRPTADTVRSISL